MKLKMHSIHFDADTQLLDLIQKKSDKLEVFFDRIIDGEVFLRLEKDVSKDNKVVEIKLNLPGSVLFAKEQSASFEAATDSAVEALSQQLKKHKGKVRETKR